MREAEIIRQRRKELGLPQMEVALEIGISLRAYQRFEYGQRKLSKASFELGLKLCLILEINPYELIEFD